MNTQLETLFKYIEPAKLVQWSFMGLQFVLVVVAAFTILKILKGSMRRVSANIQRRTHNLDERKRIDTLMRVFDYIANVVVLLVGFLIALGTIGISIAPILAAAGVVGLAVSFGAQSLVKDYFTGIILLLENQIRAGDTIEVAGKNGVVESVTLRYVRLRDGQGNVHFVPNGQITSVTNSTMDFAYAMIDIGVAYKENTDYALEIMKKVGDELTGDPLFKNSITEAMTTFGVQELANSSVVLRVRFRVVAGEQWPVKREYQRRIKMAFDEAGIEIPFPNLTIHQPEPTPKN